MLCSRCVKQLQEVGQLAYKVEADEDAAARIVCSAVEEGSLYPEEVSGHVLLRLIDAVKQETGCEVDRAVISVPAYFDESQQEATIAAGTSHIHLHLHICLLNTTVFTIVLYVHNSAMPLPENSPRMKQ